MITVHHLNNSRSQRVLWLLEELGIDYRVERYERDAKTMLAPASLKNVHPLGKSPVISDGERVVAETGAIIEYLVDRHGSGRLAPAAGSDARLRYSYWLHYAEGSLMPLMVMTLIFNRIVPGSPMLIRPIAAGIVKAVHRQFLGPNTRLHLDYVESELGRSTWFAGEDFTAADVQMSFPLEAAASRAGGIDEYPRIAAFLERIHARPAYQRALQKGGPYELLR
ncbi:glutathione S-transferase family protein [Sinimarinibacterium flocculans]|uniref:glutathione transferase n=1 Tax=Sinimarinibacterium flocculans TaxID=985250 RepID=A0A318EPG3_9GAMM|nr:glutathione S-transferase [Sinimarinibacterium flocculans]PXV71386.1 glutathione S-transferase [Sinimarinibacterium flocculans]